MSNLSNHRRRTVPASTAPVQSVGNKAKKTVVKSTLCMNRSVIEAIQRLTFGDSALMISNFRHVARLVNVPESVVFRVIRDHARVSA